MSVYVDDMYRYGIGRFGRMKMSHLLADSRDELLEFGDRLGLKRSWLQHDERGTGGRHYDISLSKRKVAVELGAVEISGREVVDFMRRHGAARTP